MLDAMGDMVAQDFLLDTASRGARRGDLGHDLDSVTVGLAHPRQAADLTLDPFQSFQTGSLDLCAHEVHIPLQGISIKRPAHPMAQTEHPHDHSHAHSHGDGKSQGLTSHDHAAGGHACCGGQHSHGDGDKGAVAPATDPVCGMKVDPATAKHRFSYKGQDYFFCGARCRERFEAEPEKFLSPREPDPAAPAGTIYTCPMHPEVRQVGPGSCPICGMALEPATVSAEAAPNEELIDMTRRFWIGAALAVPVFVLEMGGHFPGLNLHHYIPPHVSAWIQFVLATPVVLWAGWPFFIRAWASLRNRSLNMFSLIGLGVGASYGYSLAALFAPGLFPESMRMGGAVPVYFEAAAVITVLVLLGQVLEIGRA